MEILYLLAFVTVVAAAVFFVTRKRRIKATVPELAINPMWAEWLIGPVLDGVSKSVGMPRHMTRDEYGIGFDFRHPTWAAGHVHYVVFNHGPLVGKRGIRMRYRIDAAPGVTFLTDSGTPYAGISLYFQRKNDDWLAMSGKTETHRWFASFATVPLAPGEYEIVAPFTERWTAVEVSTAFSAPARFRDAIEHAESVGFVFGGGSGIGHGVCATGWARFTLLDFVVE